MFKMPLFITIITLTFSNLTFSQNDDNKGYILHDNIDNYFNSKPLSEAEITEIFRNIAPTDMCCSK